MAATPPTGRATATVDTATVPRTATVCWRRRLWGRPGDPRWVRPAVLVLLTATGLLYLLGLGASGWANSFYAAAAQAGGSNWTAFLYGSSDAANAITVDKTPASLWLTDASVRLFGLSTWSILVPQALAGVASVGVLYLAVRRWYPPGAALAAGAVFALTPVAVLMFRFNNPDSLLVLLLTLAGYAALRAIEHAGLRWLLLSGALVGFGFLTKMLQAFLVLPALGLAYLVAAPTTPLRRIAHLLAAGLALLTAAGWWVALVELVPAGSRPYIGGTQHNSVLELAFGYNGFGRITGNETGGLGNVNQEAGWLRLFDTEMGAQVSWLLPAALILLGVGLWSTRHAPRTDRTRAALLVWGGWLLVSGAVISLSAGIIHPYYTVALAPAIGALVGVGAAVLWRHRAERWARPLLATIIAVTVIWSYVLLARAPGWLPGLRYLVLFGGLAVVALLLVVRSSGPAVSVLAVLATLTALAGLAAYSVATAATPHTGAIPSAGPPGAGAIRGPGGARPGGGMALLDSTSPPDALVSLLRARHSRYRWVAAVIGSNSAAGYQLGTGYPVMAIGGFNGTDAYPTLVQFRALVWAGEIHYYIGDGLRAGRPGAGTGSGSAAPQQIAAWVAAHYPARTVAGVTVYELGNR